MSTIKIPTGISLAFVAIMFMVGFISISNSIASVFNFYGMPSPIDIILPDFLNSISLYLVSLFGVLMPLFLITCSFVAFCSFYRNREFNLYGIVRLVVLFNALIILYFPFFFVQDEFSYLAGSYYFSAFNALHILFGISGIMIVTLMPLGLIMMSGIDQGVEVE